MGKLKRLQTVILPTKEELDSLIDREYLFSKNSIGRSRYIKHVGWWIHDTETVDFIASLCKGKVSMEVGYGSGLLSHVLQDKGIEVIPVDLEEPTYRFKKNFDLRHKLDMDGAEAIMEHSPDIVIMAWPDYSTDFATRVVKACCAKNTTLIYIGERYGGCSGDETFESAIDECLNEVEGDSVTPLRWHGMHDYLTVFKPKLFLT